MKKPPRFADRLLTWLVAPHLREEVLGDMHERFALHVQRLGVRKARQRYWRSMLAYIRLSMIKRNPSEYPKLTHTDMLRNYFKIAFRNLAKNRVYSFINIFGLATGMAVAMLIGLWVYDEVSYDRYHKNYEAIAQVWSGGTNPETSAVGGSVAIQYPVGPTLRNNYPQHFKRVLMAGGVGDYTLSSADQKVKKKGTFMEGGVLAMLSLKMLKGSYQSLDDSQAIVLSKSTAVALFGNNDPVNKRLKIDNRIDVKVTGVYEDIPRNNRFGEVQFFSPWRLWVASNEWIKERETDWDNRPFNIYVQLQPNTTMDEANAAIRNLYAQHVPPDFFKTMEKDKPFVQLIPMRTWHLYSEFEAGKPAGGRITYVWLFSIIGLFVVLLACINFINLSTARSEKRAREVGIRKAVGSARPQLIAQFLSESFLVVLLAFAVATVLVVLAQNGFNMLADKAIALPFGNPVFWGIAIAFIVLTGLLAGVYPAFYLSSFQPVKVLKGALRFGRFAALPRKVLVVVQFTVSVILIMGTLIVYRQIQFVQNRPVGYDRKGLLSLDMSDPTYKDRQDLLKTELLNTGVVSGVAASSGPLTAIWNTTSGYDWPGKDPNRDTEFAICNVTHDFGKTVGWEFVAGRDFSRAITTDSTDAIIINETAARYMGLKNPVGQKLSDVDETGRLKWSKTIIGVVKDMVMESPYEPVKQTIFYFKRNSSSLLHIRINPAVSAGVALPSIEAVVRKIVPTALFDYTFVDEEYALKFSQEERIGKLASFFSVLAIFISCLGLFGLASFVAEQRTKEIGIRKVLGASVGSLWRLLSSDFVVLVIIACLFAAPISYYFLWKWLQNYPYHTNLTWWIFAASGLGALVVTLLTVSFQSIKAALLNPVRSLRSE